MYVVEFRATWCVPCQKSIPHLTELAHRFKDKGVRFVGVNVREPDTKLVRPFVEMTHAPLVVLVSLSAGQGGNSWIRIIRPAPQTGHTRVGLIEVDFSGASTSGSSGSAAKQGPNKMCHLRKAQASGIGGHQDSCGA